jgi:uncharacterized protein YjbI with pentapeptide repeats
MSHATAFVQPRIISPISGETLPLVDVVHHELLRGTRVIQISGGPGSGKTTALAHLAAVLPPAQDLVFLDDPTTSEVAAQAMRLRVVCASRQRYPELGPVIAPLPLAPWTDDELIEYLTAVAPEHCGSVMRRLLALPSRNELRGNPALWCGVLAQFMSDESLTSIRAAIQRILAGMLRDPHERRFAAEFCTAILLGDDAEATRTLAQIIHGPQDLERLRWLRHPMVQSLLAGERIAMSILSDGECPALSRRWPRPLVEEVAWLARCDSVLAERLRTIYASDRQSYQSQAATLLFAIDKTWRPHAKRHARLAGASFPEAPWPGLVLPSNDHVRSNLSDADLTRANLEGARLDLAVAKNINLGRANLAKASIRTLDCSGANLAGARLVAALADGINLREADLTGAILDDASLMGAILAEANLTQASFRHADMSFADLATCIIEGADFTGANLRSCNLQGLELHSAVLEGASFEAAVLADCDLEGIVLPFADFRRSKLRNALLTGSVMPHADFRGADLRWAGLADVQWEDTDLRNADLTGCSFHMGSTRSGLVGSPYPGHGSKTGFYTDDYQDQGFKRPEEIRKANLCGADLRGAKLDYVDFYLVDLRGARFESRLGPYLHEAGAILHDHCT